MEFQEGLRQFTSTTTPKHLWGSFSESDSQIETVSVSNTPRKKWGLFSKFSSAKHSRKEVPKEFRCPISDSLMADPVVVSSGHTFEAACVLVCKAFKFNPILLDGSKPDFSSVIPNLALQITISNWCKDHSYEFPKPPDFNSAKNLVFAFMESHGQNPDTDRKSDEELIQGVADTPVVKLNHSASELAHPSPPLYSNSEEFFSAAPAASYVPLAPRLSFNSSSSSETETVSSPEEEEIIVKMRSSQVIEIEEGVILLRNITRCREESRIYLCSRRMLSELQSHMVSRYARIQVNSVAALVNLSLEVENKVKIVRSGILPNLIDVLKGGSNEAQEHASAAIFSLALDDGNKIAIGVLGALQPLIRLLLSESEQTQRDSVLALYHLSLVQSNQSKLVKHGSVPVFLGMLKSGQMTSRILLIVGNLASCDEGRAALLDSGAVECLVGMFRDCSELDSKSTRESCVAVLYGLSLGGLRFKGLAKTAGAMDVFVMMEKTGSERTKERVRKMMEIMKTRHEEEAEDVNWEDVLEFGFSGGQTPTPTTTRSRVDKSTTNSSEF